MQMSLICLIHTPFAGTYSHMLLVIINNLINYSTNIICFMMKRYNFQMERFPNHSAATDSEALTCWFTHLDVQVPTFWF